MPEKDFHDYSASVTGHGRMDGWMSGWTISKECHKQTEDGEKKKSLTITHWSHGNRDNGWDDNWKYSYFISIDCSELCVSKGKQNRDFKRNLWLTKWKKIASLNTQLYVSSILNCQKPFLVSRTKNKHDVHTRYTLMSTSIHWNMSDVEALRQTWRHRDW